MEYVLYEREAVPKGDKDAWVVYRGNDEDGDRMVEYFPSRDGDFMPLNAEINAERFAAKLARELNVQLRRNEFPNSQPADVVVACPVCACADGLHDSCFTCMCECHDDSQIP